MKTDKRQGIVREILSEKGRYWKVTMGKDEWQHYDYEEGKVYRKKLVWQTKEFVKEERIHRRGHRKPNTNKYQKPQWRKNIPMEPLILMTALE